MQSRLSAALLAMSAIVAASLLTPVSAHTPALEAAFQTDIDASSEDMFPDAAFGVDPMVTGPVSDEFRRTQTELGCEEAQWPNIPSACYPR